MPQVCVESTWDEREKPTASDRPEVDETGGPDILSPASVAGIALRRGYLSILIVLAHRAQAVGAISQERRDCLLPSRALRAIEVRRERNGSRNQRPRRETSVEGMAAGMTTRQVWPYPQTSDTSPGGKCKCTDSIPRAISYPIGHNGPNNNAYRFQHKQ